MTPESPGSSLKSLSHSPLEQSPAAEAAISTYQQYVDGYGDSSMLERSLRVAETLRCYKPDGMPQRALDAAMLQPLADQLLQPNHPTRNHAAGLGFLEYFRYQEDDRNSRSNGYVGTLLGGLPHIDKAADGYRGRANQRMLGVFDGNERIADTDWTNLRIGANVPEIARVTQNTHIASQLARAAFTVDHIVHTGDDDQELLKNILRIEAFYAPLLEVYGLHAFDMMAQSSASKVRVLKSGNEAVLEHASATLDLAKQISTEEIMRHFFGRHPQAHLFQTAEDALYNEKIVFSSTSLAEVSDGRQSGKLHTRFKSVGKYALKLLRNPNYSLEDEARPADVFGMLAVLPDAEQLGAFLADTINQVRMNSAIDFTISASKNRPIYIQGSPDYVRRVREQLPADVLNCYVQEEEIKSKPEDHIYQVAKFTSTLHAGGQDLPVEFQFQTTVDRMNARLGVPSHMNHNSGDGIAGIIPGRPQDLHTIFMRKHDVDANGELVNPFSIPHGEEFRKRFLQSIGRR